jgi:hypothetical protein
MSLTNVPGEYALASIVGRRLSELARARDIAAAYVEPVTNEAPHGGGVHVCPP